MTAMLLERHTTTPPLAKVRFSTSHIDVFQRKWSYAPSLCRWLYTVRQYRIPASTDNHISVRTAARACGGKEKRWWENCFLVSDYGAKRPSAERQRYNLPLHRHRLTFNFSPQVFIICGWWPVVAVRNVDEVPVCSSNNGWIVYLTWSSNAVSWYASGTRDDSALNGCNFLGKTYYYAAIG